MSESENTIEEGNGSESLRRPLESTGSDAFKREAGGQMVPRRGSLSKK
jgi:hypothetical protein